VNLARLQAELAGAREALTNMEGANEALCAIRTHEQYLAMIKLGQQPALLALDAARFAARALINKDQSA
jgi:hypothetical protein